jgi:hypothetical protein
MALEITKIDFWLKALFSADSIINSNLGGRIFANIIPQQATYPLLLFNFTGNAQDVQPIALHRAMTRALYQVLVLTVGPPTDNERAAVDQVDAILGFARTKTATVAGVNWIFQAYREMPISADQYQQQAGGALIHYHRMGGDYRIEAYPA